MRIENTPQLLYALRDLGLLTSPQVEEVARLLASPHRDPANFGRVLVERGWITAYQLEQVMQGEGRGLLLGSYVLLDRIGVGGMGEVFRASHNRLRRIVALKVMLRKSGADPSTLPRFLREAETAGRLSHANIVSVYDAGQDGDRHFLAMEYIDGIDLGHFVQEAGRLPVGLACDFILQAARGLHHAHEQGFVHRDIKPSNLLVAPRPGADGSSLERFVGGTVKVLDMGLVRPHSDSDVTNLTALGVMLGTMDYLSPEQAQNPSTVDRRADLYSLGCTLYHLLAGNPPFPGGQPLEKAMRHQIVDPVPLSEVRPEVPPKVVEIVTRLMAKRPEARFATAEEVAAALEPFAVDITVSRLEATSRVEAVPTPNPNWTGPDPPRTRVSAPSTAIGPAPRRRWLVGAGVIGLLLLLAGAAALWRYGGGTPGRMEGDALADYVPGDAVGVVECRPAALLAHTKKIERLPNLAARFKDLDLPLSGVERFEAIRLLLRPGEASSLTIARTDVPNLPIPDESGLTTLPVGGGKPVYIAVSRPFAVLAHDADAVRSAQTFVRSLRLTPVAESRLTEMLRSTDRSQLLWLAVCVDKLGPVPLPKDRVGEAMQDVLRLTQTVSGGVKDDRTGVEVSLRFTSPEPPKLEQALRDVKKQVQDATDHPDNNKFEWETLRPVTDGLKVELDDRTVRVSGRWTWQRPPRKELGVPVPGG